MSLQITEVEYYYSQAADKPGEARKLLEFLSEKEVGLLAFTAFPTGDGQSQLDFFPEDPELLVAAASDAGIPWSGRKRHSWFRATIVWGRCTIPISSYLMPVSIFMPRTV